MESMTGMAALLATTCIEGTAASHEVGNAANNPLTPKSTLNLQDNFTTSFKDTLGDQWANQFRIRGLVPSDMFGLPQFLRFILPIATPPDVPSGFVTGLGDLQLQIRKPAQ